MQVEAQPIATGQRPAATRRLLGPRRAGFLYRLGIVVLTVYLGTGPVYWVPGMAAGPFMLLKYLLAAGAMGCLWLDAILSDRIGLPSGLAGFAGF